MVRLGVCSLQCRRMAQAAPRLAHVLIAVSDAAPSNAFYNGSLFEFALYY
jgi:hypothetical protein